MFFKPMTRRMTAAAASLSFAFAVVIAAGQEDGGPPFTSADASTPSGVDPGAGGAVPEGVTPAGLEPPGTPGGSAMAPGDSSVAGSGPGSAGGRGDSAPGGAGSRPAELEKLRRGGFLSQEELSVLLNVRREAGGPPGMGGGSGPDETTLRSALGSLFDADQKANEQELRGLEAKVGTLREQLRRRAERRDEIVEFRLKQLLLEAQGLGWPTKPVGEGGPMFGGPGGAMPGGTPGIGMPGMPPGGDAIPLGGPIPGLGDAAGAPMGAGRPGGEAAQVPPGAIPPEMFQRYRNEVGRRFTVVATGSVHGPVWGGADRVYTDDSSVAAAAVHTGLLKDGERGAVQVTILPGREAYEGSTANGVESASYGRWGGSYRLDPADRAGAEDEFLTETVRLSDARAEAVADALRTILGTGQGAPQVAADPRTNSVTVRAREAEIEAIKALVEQSDAPRGGGSATGADPAAPGDALGEGLMEEDIEFLDDGSRRSRRSRTTGGLTEELIEFLDDTGRLRRAIHRIPYPPKAPPGDAGRADPASVELLVAEDAPGEGLTEAVVEGTGAKVYLRGPAVVDGSQIRLADDGGGPEAGLVLHFTPAAAETLAAVTTKHRGKSLALRLDGSVVAVFKIHEPFSDRAAVAGLDESQLRRIRRIVLDSAVAGRDGGPAAAPLSGIEGGSPGADPASGGRPASAVDERFSRYRPAAAAGAPATSEASDAPDKTLAARELKKLAGTWVIHSMQVNGEDIPPEKFSAARLVIKPDGTKVFSPGGTTQPTESRLAFVGVDGNAIKLASVQTTKNSSQGARGASIYEWVDDNTIRFCTRVNGEGRPAAFSAEKGSDCALSLYKRVSE